QLDGCIVDSSKTEELLFKREYRFPSSLKCLIDKKIIEENERQRLLKFYKLRNLIIHRLVTRSFGNRPIGERNTVKLAEVKKGFEEGINLAQLLRGKSASVIIKKTSGAN